jgi:hypothetical protein
MVRRQTVARPSRERIKGTEADMRVIRTPEERFNDLPGYPFAPHYIDIDGVRLHY